MAWPLATSNISISEMLTTVSKPRVGDAQCHQRGRTVTMRRTMPETPACPVCRLGNTYPDGALLVCADYGHEWAAATAPSSTPDDDAEAAVRDANGAVLADGDAVALIKDLKVKGSSVTLKVGTRIKGIRLVGGDHAVECRTDGGTFMLKAEFLRKA